MDEISYESFFPRDATNNPDGTPNWFYFWSRLFVPGLIAGDRVVVYAPSLAQAGMTSPNDFLYSRMADKTTIYIGPSAKDKFQSCGVGNELSGIDQFYGTIIHEIAHLDQVATCDAILSTTGFDFLRFGWSFNKGPEGNHYSVGPDGKWGAANFDDDGNGLIDDLLSVEPPFEPGHGDDVRLDRYPGTTPENGDWPLAWPLPNPLKYQASYWESDAINSEDNALTDGNYYYQDWGSPGKQHFSINRNWSD